VADEAGQYEGDLKTVRYTSPRGYLSSVQASKLHQAENSVLLSDQSIEQPGMVVTLYADSQTERDRLVTQFGGVAATATYGIFALATSCDINCQSTPLPPLTVAGGAGSETSSRTTEIHTITVAGGPVTRFLPSGVAEVVASIVDGLRFLWQNPGLIPPLLAVWALLAWPAWVLARRRALLAITRGGR